MADVTETSLVQFESNFLDGMEVGSSVKPELKRYHKHETGTLRLLRASSKTFARGGDEKNGCLLPWTPFLSNKKVKNRILRFKHNIYNIVFSYCTSHILP